MRPFPWIRIAELRRRKVFGVAVGYAVAAWAAIEVVSTILQMAQAPAWIGKVVLAAVAIGFPVALVLAWFFDVTASGVVRTPATDESAPVSRSHARNYSWIVAGFALVAIAIAAVLLRPARPIQVEYQQLTNFANSATSPTLSPDGRLLAFIRGESPFFGPGEVYVKELPDGAPVQLTNDGLQKGFPKFLPDGAHIGYTALEPANLLAESRIVPVLGGASRPVISNALAMTWIGESPDPSLLYSEFTGRSSQLAIVTSTAQGQHKRTVYMPRIEVMAHRSYLSPDGKNVLVAEMNEGSWTACRLVPFDGRSSGRHVGPEPAQCTDAAWTPDGKWMYFAADTGSGSHIWRQRFPDGPPEQVTSGATDEYGIEFARDGRSFVTSIGSSQSTLWVHDAAGDRQITSEGWALLPSFSFDGRKLYYLMHRGARPAAIVSGEFWVTDLQTGAQQRLLRDVLVQDYAILPDGEHVVFCAADSSGKVDVWTARLDGAVPPRRLARPKADAYRVFSARNGDSFFLDGTTVYRVKQDGTELQRAVSTPVSFLENVSPDGKWVVGFGSAGTEIVRLYAYPTEGGAPITICDPCLEAAGRAGNFERGPTPSAVSWSADEKLLYFQLEGATYSVPLENGAMWPRLPSTPVRSKADIARLPGARLVGNGAFAGPTPSIYAFTKFAAQRNIYRVSIH